MDYKKMTRLALADPHSSPGRATIFYPLDVTQQHVQDLLSSSIDPPVCNR